MRVKIKRLNEKAVMPKKAHPSDAGFDLVATSREVDAMGNIVYGTGLAFEIPEGYVGLIFPRSSISRTSLALSNAVGVIDSHFRGEVTFKFKAAQMVNEYDTASGRKIIAFDSDETVYAYMPGERIGQLIIMPYPEVEFEEANELSVTDRGTGGYGSTGK